MTSIGSNLQEIYAACRDSSTESAHLVPNISSSRVYDASSGWGRVWKWFYTIIECIFGKDLKTERLQKVMQKTQTTFSETLCDIQEHVKQYQTYLENKIHNEDVDEEAIHLSRRKITEWNRSTAPFVSFIQDTGNEKISSLFKTFYSELIEEGAPPFDIKGETDQLQQVQELINLEGYLHEPLPLDILAKLTRDETLDKTQQQQLEKWIEKLNSKKKKIPIGVFLSALSSLVKTLDSNARLVNLEMRLMGNNLELFQEIDRQHIQWRSALQPGNTVACQGKEYILGSQLSPKEEEEGFDRTLTFSIKDNPDQVIAIGINASYWPMKEQVSQKHQWGIRMPDIHAIEENGKFAVIERMETPLLGHTWKTSNQGLAFEDKQILHPITETIKWWSNQSLCPANFSLKYLMYGRDGSLKYLHSLLPDEFDYSLLEDLVFELTQGNLIIYRHLMNESSLNKHTISMFYQEMVSNAVKNEPADSKNFAAYRKITDPEVIKRGSNLYKETQAMQRRILKTLSSEYTINDRGNLEKTLNEQLLEWHKNTYSASKFWPSIENNILENLIKRYRLKAI